MKRRDAEKREKFNLDRPRCLVALVRIHFHRDAPRCPKFFTSFLVRVRGGRRKQERKKRERRKRGREGKKSVDESNFCPFVSNTF